MANFIKARDYFDPAIYERMAQINAQNALQQGQIRANQIQQNTQMFSNLLPILAQLYTKYQQGQEAQDWATPKDYTVGDIKPGGKNYDAQGNSVVSTDLLGKPLTQPSSYSPNFGQPISTPVTIPQYQERGTFNPMLSLDRLQQAQMSQNPILVQMGQQGMQNYLTRRELAKPVFGNAGDVPMSYNDQTGQWQPGTQIPKQVTPPQPKNSIEIETGNTRTDKKTGSFQREYTMGDPVTGQPIVGAIKFWKSSNPPVGTNAINAGNLDKDTKDMMYQMFKTNGEIPNTGYGIAGVKLKLDLLNEFAQRAKAENIPGAALAAQKAIYASGKSALTTTQKMRAVTEASSTTAKANLGLVLNQLNKGYQPPTDSPIMNEFAQWVHGEKLTGDPEYQKYKNYIYTAVREYAKVVSGASGSVAGLSDTAAEEAKGLLDKAMTKDAVKAAIQSMQDDMDRVNYGWKNQEYDLKKSMRGQASGSETTPPTNPDTGKNWWE